MAELSQTPASQDPDRFFFEKWRLINTHEHGVVIIQNQKLCGHGRSVQEAKSDAAVLSSKTGYDENKSFLMIDLQLSEKDFLAVRMRRVRGISIEELGGMPDNIPKTENVAYVLFNETEKEVIALELSDSMETYPETYHCYGVDVGPWVHLEYRYTMHRTFERALDVLVARVHDAISRGWQIKGVFADKTARAAIKSPLGCACVGDISLAKSTFDFWRDHAKKLTEASSVPPAKPSVYITNYGSVRLEM